MSNKKRSEESIEKVKPTRWKKNQDKAAAIRLTKNDNFDTEPYPSGQVLMTRIVVDK